MLVLVLQLFSCFLLSSFASATEYPVHINDLFEFNVKRPLIDACPSDDVELHPPFSRRIQLTRSPVIISHPAYRCITTDVAVSYILSKLENFRNGTSLSALDFYITDCLADQRDAFNPSILTGNYSRSRVVTFGVYFFKLFKSTYPGLKRVKIDPQDLHYLSILAYAVSLKEDELEDGTADGLLAAFLDSFFGFEKSEMPTGAALIFISNIVFLKHEYTYLAAKAIFENQNLYSEAIVLKLTADDFIHSFFNDGVEFLKMLSFVKNINNAECPDKEFYHVPMHVIMNYYDYYQTVLLRPELKGYFNCSFESTGFVHFHSAAIKTALVYANDNVLLFLLRLDDSYFEETRPGVILSKVLNGLRALFLSSDLNSIREIISDPDSVCFDDLALSDILSMRSEAYPVLEEYSHFLQRPLDSDQSFKKIRQTK